VEEDRSEVLGILPEFQGGNMGELITSGVGGSGSAPSITKIEGVKEEEVGSEDLGILPEFQGGDKITSTAASVKVSGSAQHNAASAEEIAALRGEVEVLKEKLANAELRSKAFGEKTAEDVGELERQLTLFKTETRKMFNIIEELRRNVSGLEDLGSTSKRGLAEEPNEPADVKQPSPKKPKKELVKQKVVKRKGPPNFEQLGKEEQCKLFLAETDIQDLGRTLQDSTKQIQKLLLTNNGTYKLIASSRRNVPEDARRFETGKKWAARVLQKYGFKFGTATGISNRQQKNMPIVMRPPPKGPFSVKGAATRLLGKLYGQDGLILSIKNLLNLVYHLRVELQNKQRKIEQ
jgi:hypothetical protein